MDDISTKFPAMAAGLQKVQARFKALEADPEWQRECAKLGEYKRDDISTKFPALAAGLQNAAEAMREKRLRLTHILAAVKTNVTPREADDTSTKADSTTIGTGEQERKKKLPKPIESAYRSFECAEANAEVKSDRKAYEWLKEHGPADYVLPSYQTWCRNVRHGRKHYGTQKNQPRGGRTGRSIVTPDDILQRRDDDE